MSRNLSYAKTPLAHVMINICHIAAIYELEKLREGESVHLHLYSHHSGGLGHCNSYEFLLNT